MDNNIKSRKYNLESDAFKEREEFFKRTLNINPRDYFISGGDGEIVFEKSKLFKDVLRETLKQYMSANSSLFASDFDPDEYVNGLSDDSAENIPIISFDRAKIKEIYDARGSSIAEWMQNNLKEFSNNIIEQKSNPNKEKIAQTMLNSNVISAGGVCCSSMVLTYGMHGALAPVAVEGSFSCTEAIGDIILALSSHPVLLAIIAAAVVISVAILAVAALERKLVCLIVNDTKFDLSIEDIYMCHGSMTSRINDDEYNNVIPGRKRENEVYASFFVIEKNFGFYGTECTLRIKKAQYPQDAFYLLTANPLSENSRINFMLKNDDVSYNAHHYSSQELHENLYNSGGTDFEMTYELLSVGGHLNSAHGENAYASVCFKQIIDDYADFSEEGGKYYGDLKCVGSNGFEYCPQNQCYEIKPKGYCCFNSNQYFDKYYIAELFVNDAEKSNLKYYFPNEADVELLQCDDFAEYSLPRTSDEDNISANNDDVHTNETIQLSNDSDTESVYIKSLTAVYLQTQLDNSQWMKGIPDTMPLEDINIPGTHDSAAINKNTHTLYACHYNDITTQLKNGIRLLDVRIKVKQEKDSIVFMTCHSNFLSKIGVNEYQTLESLLTECSEFLKSYSSETIIMSLKIDDFAIDESRRNEAYNLLETMLKKYPIRAYNKNLGTMGDSRKKIILFNRINDEERFGYPISWADNTTGSYTYDTDKRNFKVYAQDCWNLLNPATAKENKLKYVTDTMKVKKRGDKQVVWNFMSACRLLLLGVYIGPNLLATFGKAKDKRLTNFGWLLMDYEDSSYSTDIYGQLDIPSVIIASNFGYAGCSAAFKVVYENDCLL